LSQAPPEFELEIAIYTLLTKAPGNKPTIALGPKSKPKISGVPITITPGPIIYFKDAYVAILMQALKSGSLFPFLISSSLSYSLTLNTISMAAIPTDFMVIAENQ